MLAKHRVLVFALAFFLLGLTSTVSAEGAANEDEVPARMTMPLLGVGPCTIDRLPLSDPLPTPRLHPAIFYPTGPGPVLRNAAFAAAVSRGALSARLGHEVGARTITLNHHARSRFPLAPSLDSISECKIIPAASASFTHRVQTALVPSWRTQVVRLTSSNAYSDGEVELPLRDYLAGLNGGRDDGACAATLRAANESVYLFGGNYSPSW